MSRMESADDYVGLVVRLNPNWRIIECRDRIQWILQRRGSPKMSRRNDWRGRSYCRTSEALRRCTREYAGAIDSTAAAILAALPPLIDRPPEEIQSWNFATGASARSNEPPTSSLKEENQP
jgi:hypothetical protein